MPAWGHARTRDLRGVLGAVPADHDDDDGSSARRGAACLCRRPRSGIAATARYHDHRRVDRFAGANALHDAGDLPPPRPALATTLGLEDLNLLHVNHTPARVGK